MIIGCGIFFVAGFDIHDLLFRRLRPSAFRGGLGLSLPSVNLELAFSSLSQKRSSSEPCRRCEMSLRMLKFDRDSIVDRNSICWSSPRIDNEKGMKVKAGGRYNYMANINGPERNNTTNNTGRHFWRKSS